ncbi:uncharacterized protein LOC123321281 [Coccinella septempunctata]|uniref:uncharacterized protein LOC123321281 n=1 Tax=Coccinella septempunctata TaxID=41139 RepID=UPI001D0891A6|nr:uncharacterized protein LOC123321281 [Coccinella septempunctata]
MAEEISPKQQQPLDNLIEEQLENEVTSDEETEENDSGQLLSMDKNSNLHFSAAFGMIDTMKQDLESSDQKIDAENFMGWTPLMMAIRNGHIEAVKLLLEKGADITRKNKLGVNCFNLSIANGNHELVDTVLCHMLKGGISRNRIQENLSPISLAIVFKKTHLLRILISQGFDLNAITWKTGLTPLMFAAAVSADKIISVLELKGANAKARNYMGVNYQDILQWRRHGLENMRRNCNVSKPKLSLPPIDIRNKPTASTKVSPEEQIVDAVITKPMIEKMASPIPSGNSQLTNENKECTMEVCGVTPSILVTQEVCAATESSNFNVDENIANDENDQNQINRVEGHIPPINVIKPHHVAPTRSTKDKKFVQPLAVRNDSPTIHHSYQYQSPYNGLPCPLYIPVMNSPYVSSPVTPIMIPSPYPNFMTSVGDLPQNSPMNVMPPPQNQYQCGPPGPSIFFPSPMTRPDPNFAYDTNAVNPNPNSFNGSPMFYAVYPNIPNMQNVYSIPGPKP